MGFTDYQNALRGDFDTRMASESPTTLIFWENREKPHYGGNATPQDPPTQTTGTAPWCRFVVRTSDNMDLSPSLRDDFGVAVVQCFGLTNKGSGSVEALADTVADQFRRRRVTISTGDQIKFGSVAVKEIGAEEEGWFQVNVLAKWRRIERDVTVIAVSGALLLENGVDALLLENGDRLALG